MYSHEKNSNPFNLSSGISDLCLYRLVFYQLRLFSNPFTYNLFIRGRAIFSNLLTVYLTCKFSIRKDYILVTQQNNIKIQELYYVFRIWTQKLLIITITNRLILAQTTFSHYVTLIESHCKASETFNQTIHYITGNTSSLVMFSNL